MKNEMIKPKNNFHASEPFAERRLFNDSSAYVVINNGYSSKFIRISSGKGGQNVEIEYKEEKNLIPVKAHNK